MDKMEKEVERLLDKLKGLTPGTDEYAKVLSELTTLQKLYMDTEKHVEEQKLSDRNAANDELYHEEALANEQKKLDEAKKKRWFDAILGVLGTGATVAGLVCTGRWFRMGLKFEETGCISSGMNRQLLSKLFKK